MLGCEYPPEMSALTLNVPDMRGQGQPVCLVTVRKNEERNHDSYVYMCEVLCARNVVYV
jgi:hypothetical protein